MLYTPLTKKAMKLSFSAHKEQLDKSGLPYVYHPYHLAEQMDEELAVCVALLHDVVEDSHITLKDLEDAGFPRPVIEAVQLMTHQEGLPYMDYIRNIKSDPLAAKVKLADLQHNSDLSRLDAVDEKALARVEKYKKAKELLSVSEIQDKLRGSMFAGAVGDALGYAVEFWDEDAIFGQYGPGGIQSYQLSPQGLALISDDTQMTLFTAAALILGMHRQNERGISGEPRCYANLAYRDWLLTQECTYPQAQGKTTNMFPFMMEIPELYSPRAPGMTCLSAIRFRKEQGKPPSSFVEDKINNSKGCGGVMRVAPVGLALHFYDVERLAREGAEIAAITHSHSLGYMPAAVLTLIVNRLAWAKDKKPLRVIVEEARDAVAALYKDDPHIQELTDIIDRAICLSENTASDLENIHQLGEGWVAEETLAIAIYCSLRYEHDFSGAIIAAVNHKGDSDSTGAVTGNILGAHIGYEAIEQKWKQNLELSYLTLKLADRLYELFV